VHGLEGGELRLTDGTETLAISADGPFRFSTEVADGGAYAVRVEQQPAGHRCTVEAGEGTIEGADATGVVVRCLGDDPALRSLSLADPAVALAPRFDPERTDYSAVLGPLVRTVAVRAAPNDPRATWTIRGSADVAAPVRVERDEPLSIEVTAPSGRSRTYRVELDREGPLESTFATGDRPSVAVFGDTLAVGATLGPSEADDGFVAVYARREGRWEPEAVLRASESADSFGSAVALWEDTLVVGAPSWHADDCGARAAAFVFERTDGGWTQTGRLQSAPERRCGELVGPDDPREPSYFGASVAVHGERVAVGAPNELDPGGRYGGAVYLFEPDGEGWSEAAALRPHEAGLHGRHLGRSVGLFGDTLVAGDDQTGSPRAGGAAQVFVRDPDGWRHQSTLVGPHGEGSGDRFGFSVALWEDRIVVGAPEEDSPATGVDGDGAPDTLRDSGAAFVFRREDEAWVLDAYLKASNAGTRADPYEGDRFGSAVSIHGDAIAVGASWESSRATGVDGDGALDDAYASGAAYVFSLGVGGWAEVAYLKPRALPMDGVFGHFGRAVAVFNGTIAVGSGQGVELFR